jgi:hydrogenase nickel incorporation protein HypA/HybF
MHELSIANSILDIVLRRAREDGFGRVHSVYLKIGRLSGIEPESLRFCFGVVSADTIAESARIEVELVPLRGKCARCGEEFDMAEIGFVCPRCHNSNIEVISGTEMLMDKMEVE